MKSFLVLVGFLSSMCPTFAMDYKPDIIALSSSFGAGAFVANKKYQCRRFEEIYLVYSNSIDTENVLEVPGTAPGLKIYRTKEKDEVGYIVPNFLQAQGEIRIGAVWIKENMRTQGYATAALTTFMALCRAKKTYFPGVKKLSFYTTKDNLAMKRVGQKLDFAQKDSPDELSRLFGGIYYQIDF